ncbi:MAG: redoxin domain-containing protein [Bacteroidetes bacterium]|jgi:peroxiredoxin|nr:redoxin domain-containing protein [Bacteroidota bacterium]
MAIERGQPAPEFKLYDDQREAFRLSDYHGEKPVLLLFFPGAFTSVCTTELNTVNNELEEFGGADAQIVGISTDSPFVLNEFKNVHKLQFPLLSDHDGSVSATYGAKYDNDFTDMRLDRISKRAAFVIDEEGIVQYAEVLENAGKMPDFNAIKQVLQDVSA